MNFTPNSDEAPYVLAVAHAIGAGTDGRSAWILAMLTLLTAPIVFAFSYRMLPTRYASVHRKQQVNPSAAMPRRAERPAREPPNDQGTSPRLHHGRARMTARQARVMLDR